jgi:beta-galactosidase
MIKLRQELVPGEHLPEIPEIGLLFQLDQSFENLTWYGRGAHENYWDRAVSARIGLYTGKVSEQYVPYLRPQECGNKTDVRYARLVNGHGIGLEFFGSSLFERCKAKLDSIYINTIMELYILRWRMLNDL